MRATIDKAGRVVVPKALREAIRLRPGVELELRLVGDALEIRPAPLEVAIERRGGIMVAVPRRATGTLTARDVEVTLAALRSDLDLEERPPR